MHPGTGWQQATSNKQLGPRSVTLVVFVALLAYKVDAKSKIDSVKSSAGSETFSAACIELFLTKEWNVLYSFAGPFTSPMEIGHSYGLGL